jgi:hypothetical protein
VKAAKTTTLAAELDTVNTAPTPARSTKATKAAPAVATRPKAKAPRIANVVLQVPTVAIDTSTAAAVAANLLLQHTHPAGGSGSLTALVPAHPATAPAVKRGSSALRHAKENAANPVVKQLQSVFGPAALPPETMRRFAKGAKIARAQRLRGTTSFHSAQPNVPHRSVG